jgi:flavin reductase (DIM6/NTAB) family NADH-FMN oxidoreductase RutF
LGADPALVGFVNRPLEAGGHTLANIEATGFYTINHIHASFVEKAHQTSAKYAEGESEFLKIGLTEQRIENFEAPFVAESKIKFGVSLQQIIPITLNNTFFVIGKIEMVFVDESLIQPDGFIDLVKAQSLSSSGIDAYHTVNYLDRFAYAKPNLPVTKINHK